MSTQNDNTAIFRINHSRNRHEAAAAAATAVVAAAISYCICYLARVCFRLRPRALWTVSELEHPRNDVSGGRHGPHECKDRAPSKPGTCFWSHATIGGRNLGSRFLLPRTSTSTVVESSQPLRTYLLPINNFQSQCLTPLLPEYKGAASV